MKKIFLLLILSLSTVYVSAESIDSQSAQQIARNFLASRGKTLSITTVAPVQTFAATSVASAPYYVFNADGGNGFVIVSGNSLTEPILGYSDTDTFDANALPEHIQSWLQTYADQIEWVAAHEQLLSTSQAVKSYATRTRHSVAPILTCTWNQGDPYNASCPIYYSGSSSGVSATGCIATALVQTMYFYKYPAEVKETIPSYSWNNGRETVRFDPIPAGTKLDWDNMLDNYDGSYTDAQKQAVADLNFYVGQAVQMGYGASSGSSYWNAEEVFEKYFGYDDAVYVARNTDYDIQEWFEMIYSEVADGYPVAYGGSSTGGGHAFVLDGFDGEGFFHVNWGWGGMDNGYFRLTVLNPDDGSCSDLVSSASGFTMAQDAILQLRSEDDGVVDVRNLNLSVSNTRVTNNNVRVIYNNSTGSTNSYECACLTLSSSGDYIPVGEIVYLEDMESGNTSTQLFDLSNCFSLPGEYKITPASRVAGTETWYPYWTLNTDNYILATVDEDLSVVLTLSTNTPNVSVTKWDYTGNLAVNTEQRIIATFTNNGGEYNQEVSFYASTTTSRGSSKSRALVGVLSGGESKAEFYFTPDAEGEWNLWLSDGSDLGTNTMTVVSESNAKKVSLAVNNISISNNSIGNRLVGSATIKNNNNDTFNGNVKVQLWKRDPSSGVAWTVTSSLIALSDLASEATQSGSFNFTNLEIGSSYYISFHYTTQDGSLDGGDIDWSNPYTLQTGVLTWNNYGQMSGSTVGSSLETSRTTSGVLCESVSPATIVPSNNTNTLYAFTDGASVSSGVDGYNVVIEKEAEKIALSTLYVFYNPTSFTAKEATLTHTFVSSTEDGTAGWEAITLPFKPDGVRIDGVEATWKQGDGAGDFYLREFGYEDNAGLVIFTDVESLSTMRANTPYVIAATPETAGKTVEFYATDAYFPTSETPAVVSTDDYLFYGSTTYTRESDIYVLNSTRDAYEYKSSQTSVDMFANYFKTTLSDTARPEKIYISTELATGIHQVPVTTTADNNYYYDLQGRRISTPTKGVYLLNGKKYVK